MDANRDDPSSESCCEKDGIQGRVCPECEVKHSNGISRCRDATVLSPSEYVKLTYKYLESCLDRLVHRDCEDQCH